MIGRVADHLLAHRPGHRLRVAVEGVSAAGTSAVADGIAAALQGRRPVVRPSVDGERLDLVPAPADAVLIVDGTSLQAAEREGPWDDVVFVDLGPDQARAAGAALGEVDREARAGIVIDDSVPERPVLRRIGGTADDTAPLFSYGTLRQADAQVATFGRELAGAPDRLPGHRRDWVTITDPAVIAASGSDRHPIVRATDDPADSVAGTVLTLTTAELASADHYEVDDYRRVRVTLASGAEAWVYLAAD